MTGNRGVLFVGWRGAIQTGQNEEDSELSADFFRLWRMAALSSLRESTPAELRLFQGKSIPVDQLLTSLLRRLTGIAAAASVNGSDCVDEPIRVDFASVFSGAKHAEYAEMSVRQWSASVALFLQRLQVDAERIADWLGVKEIPSIVSLAVADSDLHDSGGAVIRISFENGSTIFYKPRPVTGELFWRELTNATEKVEPACKVTSARVLCSDGYGWMEELLKLDLSETMDRESYWCSAGSLLCHAWLAHMTDLHMGNILATRMGPAVVDAECLATPAIESDDSFDAIELAMELSHTGLLPSRGWEDGVPDVSGFFGRPSAVPAIRLPVWIASQDRRVSVTFKSGWLRDPGNSLEDVPPIASLPALMKGFMHAAQATHEIRPSLLQPGGWLERLEAMHAPRVVLRSTLSYGLQMSDVLLSEEGERRPYSPSGDALIYEAERRSIERLYVPRFVMPPGSRDVAVDPEGSLVRNMFQSSGADSIRRRLEQLSVIDLSATLKTALLAQML